MEARQIESLRGSLHFLEPTRDDEAPQNSHVLFVDTDEGVWDHGTDEGVWGQGTDEGVWGCGIDEDVWGHGTDEGVLDHGTECVGPRFRCVGPRYR